MVWCSEAPWILHLSREDRFISTFSGNYLSKKSYADGFVINRHHQNNCEKKLACFVKYGMHLKFKGKLFAQVVRPSLTYDSHCYAMIKKYKKTDGNWAEDAKNDSKLDETWQNEKPLDTWKFSCEKICHIKYGTGLSLWYCHTRRPNELFCKNKETLTNLD